MTTGVFPPEVAEMLAAPHVVATILGEFTVSGQVFRLHGGAGVLNAYGKTWYGVTDPTSPRAVSIDAIDCPDPSIAAAVKVTLSGVDAAFVKSMRSDRTGVEGSGAGLYLAVFNPDTMATIGPMVPIFVPAWMTSPTINRAGQGTRDIEVTLESRWANRNFAPGGRLTDADQQQRFPGDTALEFVGGFFQERWPV